MSFAKNRVDLREVTLTHAVVAPNLKVGDDIPEIVEVDWARRHLRS